MSAKAEEFARQLLEKTENGKLKWQFVPDPDLESYKSDADDGISFSIKRKATRDDKVITFELTELGRVVLSDTENNFPTSPFSQIDSDPTRAWLDSRGKPIDPIISEKIKRFRLYSDLFYAARATAEGGDQAMEKAQQFLARLA
jgi:hypothetical protein